MHLACPYEGVDEQFGAIITVCFSSRWPWSACSLGGRQRRPMSAQRRVAPGASCYSTSQPTDNDSVTPSDFACASLGSIRAVVYC